MASEMGHKPNFRTLDVTFDYDKTYLANLFDNYGAIGKTAYFNIEWQIDLLFPILYGLLFFGMIQLLILKGNQKNLYFFSFTPLFASIFDLLENSFILFFLKTNLTKITDFQVLVCTTFTKLKYTFIATSLLVILYFSASLLLKKKIT